MFSSKEIVETVRKRYPVGCCVRLVKMDDVQAPPIGTLGTVYDVDDAILEIVISVNGEYFDSEVSPAKIGTKEVQVLMDEVA